jgi:3'-phosphoadenosine 5'-phosphosulfate (PAPS) 3'-phosphatase
MNTFTKIIEAEISTEAHLELTMTTHMSKELEAILSIIEEELSEGVALADGLTQAVTLIQEKIQLLPASGDLTKIWDLAATVISGHFDPSTRLVL